jgi:hypothetical protein
LRTEPCRFRGKYKLQESRNEFLDHGTQEFTMLAIAVLRLELKGGGCELSGMGFFSRIAVRT